MISSWLATLGLVFGGCCSNAITLEQLTSQHPQAGSLITFFQFVLVSLHGLPGHVKWTRYGPRLKPRRIPIGPYLIQVVLFYFISLLNNAAFGYAIPMSVHIIFRSGGLVITLLLGWVVSGKRYPLIQVLSVLVVTAGVVLTTLSASNTASASRNEEVIDPQLYMTGIAILTLALILSGFLGLVQDYTYSTYARPKAGTTKETDNNDFKDAWKESMFYLHFLSLPMFVTLLGDLRKQIQSVNAGPKYTASFPISSSLSSALGPALSIPPPFSLPFSFLGNTNSSLLAVEGSAGTDALRFSLRIPAAYIPLFFNTVTQLICVAGVNRLTTRVSALTVTLVLVVRKAASLVLSVMMSRPPVDMTMMWSGAALVLLGTVGYSLGGKKKQVVPHVKKD